jgi:uncharacterized protein (DUF58 family)
MTSENHLPDPEVLAKMRDLELRARLVVEGYLSGMHRSPYHGFSTEFAQHREYVPGDEVKRVDWKVYGRTERYFVKEFEEETNLICWLLVDSSESMRYGSGAWSKYDCAAAAAAALAYLVLRQQDRVGLATFDEGVRALVRPSGQPSQLKEVVRALAAGASRERTRLAPVFHDLAERLTRRGLVFVLSDFFDDVPDLLGGLRHLRYKRHEVVLLHVLDPAELEFPFEGATRFRGLEREPDLRGDARGLREGYLAEMGAFLDALRRGSRDQNMDYVRLRTDASLAAALAAYLVRRSTRKGR